MDFAHLLLELWKGADHPGALPEESLPPLHVPLQVPQQPLHPGGGGRALLGSVVLHLQEGRKLWEGSRLTWMLFRKAYSWLYWPMKSLNVQT